MMVFLDGGLSDMRDIISYRISNATVGTGTASTSYGDTGLDEPLSATTSDVTKTITDRQVDVSFVLSCTSALGEQISEIIFDNNDGTVHNIRDVFSPLPHNSRHNGTFDTAIFVSRAK